MSATFQPPSRSLTVRDYQFIALAVVLFLLVAGGLVYANLTLTGGGDFFVHWAGARAFLFDKVDPYGGEIPARVQQLVYGGAAKAGDEPYILDTPFQLLPFYYPFALFSEPTLARALFTLFLELALFAIAFLGLRLAEVKVSRSFTVLFVFFSALNFYSYEAVQEASPVLILGLIYIGILFALRAELDELVGALLAVSLYYWEVGAPFLFIVFLRIYYEKRTRVLAGFIMLSFILLFISFLTYPYWVIPFLRATVNNLRVDFGLNVHTIFMHFWPSQGGFLAWLFITLLLAILGYEWSLARSGDERRFYWSCCLSLAVAPLLGFRTEMEHLAILIIPLALILILVQDRWHRSGGALVILFMLILAAVPWLLYLFAADRFGDEITFLFLPLMTVMGLYWIRWWAIRPPRTWKDLANQL